MEKLFIKIGVFIRRIIDFFYPPFKKYVTLNVFRYGASGGLNLLFDSVLYFLIFNFVLRQQMLHLGFVTLSSHIAALAIKLPITTLSGFLLQKYVTFSHATSTKGRVQLMKYVVVVGVNILLNYLGLKLFVDVLHFFPSIANVTNFVLTAIFSYFAQKKFTFRSKSVK